MLIRVLWQPHVSQTSPTLALQAGAVVAAELAGVAIAGAVVGGILSPSKKAVLPKA